MSKLTQHTINCLLTETIAVPADYLAIIDGQTLEVKVLLPLRRDPPELCFKPYAPSPDDGLNALVFTMIK